MTNNTNYHNPPSQWKLEGVVFAGDDTYYRVRSPEGRQPGIEDVYVWHWCTAYGPGPGETVDNGRWMCAGVRNHTLVGTSPLHLEPSILWNCCNKHGYIREGRWVSA